MPELDASVCRTLVLNCEFRVINLTEALVPLVLRRPRHLLSEKLCLCPTARRAGGSESSRAKGCDGADAFTHCSLVANQSEAIGQGSHVALSQGVD